MNNFYDIIMTIKFYCKSSCVSLTARSGMLSLRACPTVDRDPRMHVMAARSKLKFTLALSHPKTVEYCRSRLSASREARCFKKVVVSGLAPPDVLNTSGVNVAFSTSKTLSSYLLRLALSWRR